MIYNASHSQFVGFDQAAQLGPPGWRRAAHLAGASRSRHNIRR
jgi:hypothetical protein